MADSMTQQAATTLSFEEEMLAFATALLRFPDNPLAAALTVHPRNPMRADYIALNFANHPQVQVLKAQLAKNVTVENALPSREEVLLELAGIFQNKRECAADRVKAAQAYDSIMGWSSELKKPKQEQGKVNKEYVMVYPLVEDEDTWEKEAKSRQSNLVTDQI